MTAFSPDVLLPLTNIFEKNQVLEDWLATIPDSFAFEVQGIQGPFYAKLSVDKSAVTTYVFQILPQGPDSPRKRIGLIPTSGKIFFSFNLRGGFYFCQTSFVRKDAATLILYSFEEIFRIQRRNHFRYRIPETSKMILSWAENPQMQVLVQLIDLSGGGFRAQLPPGIPIKIFDRRNATIRLEQDLKIQTKFEIRRLSKDEFGAQFLFASAVEKNRMETITLEIYRKIYLAGAS